MRETTEDCKELNRDFLGVPKTLEDVIYLHSILWLKCVTVCSNTKSIKHCSLYWIEKLDTTCKHINYIRKLVIYNYL